MVRKNVDGTIKYNYNGTMTVLEQTISSLEKKREKAERTIKECDVLIIELKRRLKR